MLGNHQSLQESPQQLHTRSATPILLSEISISDPGSRKRTREFWENEDIDQTAIQMQFDRNNELPSIHSLQLEYLAAARHISQERVRKLLFTNCEEDDVLLAPQTPRMHFSTLSRVLSEMDTAREPPTISTTISGDDTTQIVVPTRIFHLIDFLAKRIFCKHVFNPQQNAKLFSTKSANQSRVHELNELMEKNGICDTLNNRVDVERDASEMAFLVLDFLKNKPPLLSLKFHGALKGILFGVLTFNNVSGTRFPGASIPLPSDSTIKLIRSILIMIDTESRQLLHYIMDFLRRICDCTKARTNLVSTVRNLSQTFGPLLVGISPASNSAALAWTESLCELLVYAHGGLPIGVEAAPSIIATPTTTDRKVYIAARRRISTTLWRVTPALQDAISDRVGALRTPSRRAVMMGTAGMASAMTTPSRRAAAGMSVTPSRRGSSNSSVGAGGGAVNGGSLNSSRRTLFPSARAVTAAVASFTEVSSPSHSNLNSPTRFAFASTSSSFGNATMQLPMFAFGSNSAVDISKGSNAYPSAMFLSSVNADASMDRNSFSKRLRIE
ncbi:hypothetical protein HK100_001596 [Physocladia obscura]|uniref:Rho-GAP domain-containing protein n=1 Tax=Physocladia obscura TaxID=109957 RepID=A0AAD5T869_9FUNG|nr:hypothetical protein HK100_001596 [Physocladia obscura]